MSYLVLHMDKFKKEAVRGIQSHNNRERESHSNPDINYERSSHNYDLHEPVAVNYSEAIQNRIDDLLLVKAVRKDAVQMCGLIVSSDREFFWKIGPEETRRFFEESKSFLTEFVGAENVISAMVHMDEKTPHMHFLHVPVTPDGRLNAKNIYTRESLKKLQTELPKYLQSRGFDLQRGVEQEPGSAKKHLNTREFKQQKEALHNLENEAREITRDALKLVGEMGEAKKKEAELLERLQSYEQQAQDAEKTLSEQHEIPQASMFNYKSALETAQVIIESQKKVLAAKSIITAQKEKQQVEIQHLSETVNSLTKNISRLEAEKVEEERRSGAALKKYMDAYSNASARLEEIDKFFRWNQDADRMHLEYRQEQIREKQRKAAEQKRQAEELQRQEAERVRQAKEQEQQIKLELERQEREREASRAQQWKHRPRGMGMGR